MLIKIKSALQILEVENKGRVARSYSISTAKKGLGENRGSEMTPRGWHQIKIKIGQNCPPNTVFVGRRQTGEIYSKALAQQFPNRDWILTRIIWLTGLEPGVNQYGNVDTLRRYIYIHGVPDEVPMGIALSHGCIRMRNQEIIELFNLVSPGTQVLIS